MEKALDTKNEKTLAEEELVAELEEKIQAEQFGQLLTKSVTVIGISLAGIVFTFSIFKFAPVFIEKLVSFF